MLEVVLISSVSRGAAYGVGTYTKELIYCLQQSGVKVNVVELGMNIPEFRTEETDGLNKLQFPLGMGNDNNYYNRIASFLKLHIRDSSDVVFLFNFTSQKGLMEQIKIKFPKAKTTYTVHYLPWSTQLLGNADTYRQLVADADKKPPKKFVSLIQSRLSEKELFDKADTVIALSDDTSSLLADVYSIPREKIFQITNGLRDACSVPGNQKMRFRKQFHIDQNEIVLLYVGRFDRVKGVNSLLNSFKKIVAKHDNCRLVLIGDGDTSMLKDYSTIMSKVIITGKIDRKEVDKWYTIADIGLFPSYYEECSYVGIEMMMHSLPVVASDGYSVKNMFHDGQNALVAKRSGLKNNRAFEKDLFDNISRLIESKELRDRIAAKGRKTYEEMYHVCVMQNNYKRLLDSYTTSL